MSQVIIVPIAHSTQIYDHNPTQLQKEVKELHTLDGWISLICDMQAQNGWQVCQSYTQAEP